MENNIDNKAIIERTITQLKELYNGDPWVTENLVTKVLSIAPDDAFKKTEGHNHSVAELLAHIIAWRNFSIQKLNGNYTYDIEDDSPVNWPTPDSWEAVCVQFESIHKELISAIENLPSESWTTTVPGRNYSFIYLITGIIQHDYYHYGQIGSVLAAIKKLKEVK